MTKFTPGTKAWAKNLTDLMNVLFALALTTCLTENTWIFDFFTSFESFSIKTENLLSIFLVFSLIVWSWIGYHQSLSVFPYRKFGFGFFRGFIDIFIIILYFFMAYNIQNYLKIFWVIFLIYGLYFFSGIIRIFEWEYDKRASKWWYNLIFVFIFFFIWFISFNNLLNLINYDYRIILLIEIILIWSYRVIRRRLGYPKKLIIGIDIDGTLSEQVGAAITYLQKEGKALNTTIDMVNHWYYKIDGKIDIAEFFKEQYTNNPEFVLNQSPIVGAVSAMKELYEDHHLIILTARPGESKDATTQWLKENDIKYHEIYHIYKDSKIDFGIDLLIDDSPYEALKASKAGTRVLLYSRKYNELIYTEDLTLNRWIIRNKDWSEILKNIKRIAGN